MTSILDREKIAESYQLALTRLTRAIAFSEGQFSLILVSCDNLSQQQNLFQNLESQFDSIAQLTLSPETDTLFTPIHNTLHHHCPSALMVFGLETVLNLKQVLSNANLMRNTFAQQFPFPVILWINPKISATLSRIAPDFKNWATSPISFPTVPKIAPANSFPLKDTQKESSFLSPPQLQDWSAILAKAKPFLPEDITYKNVTGIVILKLRSFAEITLAIDSLKRRHSVVIDLRNLVPEEAQRSLNFLSGGIYALNGDLLKIGKKIFLFTPSCVELSTKLSS